MGEPGSTSAGFSVGWLTPKFNQEDFRAALCMTSVLAQKMLPRSGNFQRILRRNTFLIRKSILSGGFFFASTEVMHRGSDESPLHSDIRNSYDICTE